ncbi:MAG: hypothetical protein DYG83_09420 [Candidatus Brocadia sp. AMX2]|uniref:Lipoprotein n=1 Tax=Candidatus Brocadia sinica JPN1 TaxID=1197129 RepID=A0ABQ0JXS7_9BACT|nr:MULTISPECIES: hypothetical protein [Brocadia]MBC6932586.1 hypothetical protein [Candidatus Brocadia sp.]MBL1169870.1 hypothetical protein [Candidatus Brocadia sp. AMX1]MCK6467837.1 hypothetical protein [Candidatus Brocadia sinica]NOG40626.1 hypothetical protein [Planctomycetota bacterium]KAA0244796.1 MAG: hypothetical protein EDM70_05400 [Candidatus Brocadia sp. AMX2]
MHIHGHILYILLSSLFPLLLFSCGSERVNIEFRTSRQIYVDDTKTDPDKLNKELEYDIREAEKKRLQKQRSAEEAAKAKAEAERKARPDQGEPEQTNEEETMLLQETEQQPPQQ